ncbi:hypothetical protein HN51_040686, partial [Arachis hypogaea]
IGVGSSYNLIGVVKEDTNSVDRETTNTRRTAPRRWRRRRRKPTGADTTAASQTYGSNLGHEHEPKENWRGVIIVLTLGGATSGGSGSRIHSQERRRERIEERRKGIRVAC